MKPAIHLRRGIWHGSRCLIWTMVLLAPVQMTLAAWSDLSGQVAIDQTSGVYDRANRQYISRVTLTNTSGAAIIGPVRLVVEDTNKVVLGPDGTTAASEPYFGVLTAGASLAAGGSLEKTLLFERGRGRLSYMTRAEQDQGASTNISGTITGTAIDAGTGTGIPDVSLRIGTSTVHGSTGSQGTYVVGFTNSEVDHSAQRGDHVTINASRAGYTSYQGQVSVAGEDGSYTLDFSLVPVAASVVATDPEGSVIEVDVSKDAQPTASLSIPPGAVEDGSGTPVSEALIVEMTPLDPSAPAELSAFPGANFLVAQGDANNPVTLDPLVLAQVNITGQDTGNAYHGLGAPATIEMLIPPARQGDLAVGSSVPLWYYDEATGLWVQEGSAAVEMCSFDPAQKCVRGEVAHFTDWSAGYPEQSHACFKGSVTALDGATPVSAQIYAEGASYTGTSTGQRDYADPATWGLTVKRSDGVTEQVRLHLYQDGQQKYFENPLEVDTNTFEVALTPDGAAAHLFTTPSFFGSTMPSPDAGACQALNLRLGLNRAPVVNLIAPGSPQNLGSVVHIDAGISDPDGNFDQDPANIAWSADCGTLENETLASADLRGSGATETCTVTLVATDQLGAVGTDSRVIDYAIVPPVPLPDLAFSGRSVLFPGQFNRVAAIGDLDNDGDPDLVTGNIDSVQIALAGQRGVFQPPTSIPLSDRPYSLALGDVNNDGNLDLLTDVNGQQLWLGNGDGSFQQAAQDPRNFFGHAQQIVDVDADGNADLLSIDWPGVYIAKGNGDGTFANPFSVDVGTHNGSTFVVTDLNGDGVNDIAAASVYEPGIGVSYGNADGSFQAPVIHATDQNTDSLAIGDVNEDGSPDLLSVYQQTRTILPSDGAGGFGAAMTTAIPENAFQVRVADLDRDGHLDLVTGADSYVMVFHGTGSGDFAEPLLHPVQGDNVMFLADLNLDGALDTVSLFDGNLGSYEATILFGNADGTLDRLLTTSLSDGQPVRDWAPDRKFSLADLDADGTLDVAVSLDYQLRVLFNDGSGRFPADLTLSTDETPRDAATGDLNGDGVLDIVSGASVFIGNGDGSFYYTSNHSFGRVDEYAITDVDNDNDLDLLFSSGAIYLAPNDGFGNIDYGSYTGLGGTNLRAQDFDGDGRVDLAFGSYDSSIHVARGNGDGSFTEIGTYPLGASPWVLASGDLNGDGALDLVTTDSSGSLGIVTFLGRGDGTFDTGPTYAISSSSGVFALVVADLNLDGKPEVIVGLDDYWDDSRFARLFIVELGDGGVFESPMSIYIGKPFTGVEIGDMNGDGRPDVVLRDKGSNSAHQQINVLLQR